MPIAKLCCVALTCLALGACYNDNIQKKLDLGDATIGQQLIDLKAALEADAISEAEYRRVRQDLVNLLSKQSADEDKSDSDDEADDEFSWL